MVLVSEPDGVLETQARSTFRVALGEELQKRNMEIPFYVEENIDLSIMDANDRKKELIKVSMISKYGEKVSSYLMKSIFII